MQEIIFRMLWILNLICVVFNSFVSGMLFTKGDPLWASLNLVAALINAVVVILYYFKKGNTTNDSN